MNLDDEKQLIDKVKGDKDSFKLIFTKYHADIYRYCYSFVNNKQKAEDLTSEAFLKGYEKFDSFQWQGLSIKFWLIGIARNIIYKQFAKPGQLAENLQRSEFEEVLFSGDDVNYDLAEDVMKYLSQLPELTREIIVLKVWEEYKFDEISTLVGMTESGVKMQFYRGIERLRQLMSKDGYDDSQLKLPVLFGSIMFSKEAYEPDLNSVQRVSQLLSSNSGVVNSTNLLNVVYMSNQMKVLLVLLVLLFSAGGSVGGYFLYQSITDGDSNVQEKVKSGDSDEQDDEKSEELTNEDKDSDLEPVKPDDEQTSVIDEKEEVNVDPDAGKIVYRYEFGNEEYKLTLNNPDNLSYRVENSTQWGETLFVDLDSSEAELVIYLSSDTVYEVDPVYGGGLCVSGGQVSGDLYRVFYSGFLYSLPPVISENTSCYLNVFNNGNNGVLYSGIKLPQGMYSQGDISPSTLQIADNLMMSYQIQSE